MARKGVVASLGDLFFTISPDMGGFARELTHGVSSAASSTMLTVGNAVESLGKAVLKKFTLPLAVATAANIAQFQALDREIRSTLTLFGTAPSLVDETFNQMSSGITQVSEDVGGLESAIADGLYQAISAGIPKDNVFAFLETAQMAAIADKTADLTSSVDAITTMMNAFSSEELSAAEASDILFAAVAQGKTTFGELGASIGRAAGIASAAGVAAAEYAAAIATITQPGLETSEAVSYLRAAITGILRPGEEMNAIFQQLGYSSAEAAIPIIGLQPAFQAVVSAAGGSTSKLQELIGSAEGVNAILSITGENAGVFAKSLRATENAAGATSAAFKIADAGIGRSFGKMTEAFDRLGNMFGAWGTQFVQPVVDFITDAIDNIRAAFETLDPVIEAFAAAFRTAMEVVNLPVIKQVLSLVVALGIAFAGLLGLLGPIIVAIGLTMKAFALLKGIQVITNLIVAFRLQMIIAAEAAQGSMAKFAKSIGPVLRTPMGKLGAAAEGLGTKIGAMKTAALGAGLIFLGIAAAVGIAIVAYQKHKSAMERLNSETLFVTEGVDRLAESLGITLTAMGEIDFEGLKDADLSPTFNLENAGVIRGLVDVMGELGDEAAKDYILGMAFEFQSRGATPVEVMTLIDHLEASINKDFDITINMVVPKAQFDWLEEKINFVQSLDSENMYPTFDMSPTQGRTLKDSADLLVRIFETQGYDAYIKGLGQVQDELGGTTKKQNEFADSLMLAFERSAEGQNLGFSGIGSGLFGAFGDQQNTIAGAQQQIEDALPGMKNAALYAEELNRAMTDGVGGGEYLGSTRDRVYELTEAQEAAIATQAELIGGIPAVFAAATAEIDALFNQINARILASMPVLDIYTGAITQDFDKWVEGQNQYQKDIIAIAGLRQRLIDQDLPGNVLEAFDNSSMGLQAWLATLGADDLETAVAEMTESYGAAIKAGQTTFGQEQANVVATAVELIQAEYDKMELAATTAGGQVPANFNTAFATGAAVWAGNAETYVQELAGIVGREIPGPLIGAPRFSSNVYTVTVNVTSAASANPGKAVSQSLQASGMIP